MCDLIIDFEVAKVVPGLGSLNPDQVVGALSICSRRVLLLLLLLLPPTLPGCCDLIESSNKPLPCAALSRESKGFFVTRRSATRFSLCFPGRPIGRHR